MPYLGALYFRLELGEIRVLNQLALHRLLRSTLTRTPLLHRQTDREIQIQTFCISALETKDWATLSRLWFKTSVMEDVMASACFEGMPCASNPLTYQNQEHLEIIQNADTSNRPVSSYQRQGVDEESPLSIGLPELRRRNGPSRATERGATARGRRPPWSPRQSKRRPYSPASNSCSTGHRNQFPIPREEPKSRKKTNFFLSKGNALELLGRKVEFAREGEMRKKGSYAFRQSTLALPSTLISIDRCRELWWVNYGNGSDCRVRRVDSLVNIFWERRNGGEGGSNNATVKLDPRETLPCWHCSVNNSPRAHRLVVPRVRCLKSFYETWVYSVPRLKPNGTEII